MALTSFVILAAGFSYDITNYIDDSAIGVSIVTNLLATMLIAYKLWLVTISLGSEINYESD